MISAASIVWACRGRTRRRLIPFRREAKIGKASFRAAQRENLPHIIGGQFKIENIEIFDFDLSDEEMRQISAFGSAKGRLTDFGFAPKWD